MEPQEGKMAGVPKPRTISTKQARIASLARQMPETALHSVSHHMDMEWMREAFGRTRKDGARGVDGQSAAEYADELDTNLQDLLNRAKSGRYRAPPVRRVYIPKGDGSKVRPLGIPTIEDKILQRGVKMLLEPIYEQEFYDFSYGFRPGRSAHDALEALDRALWEMHGGYVLDADVTKFFDTINHGQLQEILRQRVIDGTVVRLVGKWLRAGVLEDGVVHHSEGGTPQGGVISPLLANIYLHEVLDTWWVKQVLPRLRGRAVLIRYADDFVVVFSDRDDAERVQKVLVKRFERYGLTLHPEKTRLVPFRRPRRDGKGGRPGSFDFLGFTHYWGRTRKGYWIPMRKTAKGRFSRALRTINQWLKAVRHLPVKVQALLLGAKLRGYYNYYGIQGNSKSLNQFFHMVKCMWKKWLSRRSQKAWLTWEKFRRLLSHHRLPAPRVRARCVQGRFWAKP